MPSRVRLELPDRTTPGTDTVTVPRTDATGRAAATAEESTR